MSDNLAVARQILEEEDCTLVLVKSERVYKSKLRGVAPMLDFIDKGIDLSGFSAADKVVGRGAAMLFAYAKIDSVHSKVMSRAALQCLEKFNICAEYDILCDNIINRKGDGICPMEEATAESRTPQEAIAAIRAKYNQLKFV